VICRIPAPNDLKETNTQKKREGAGATRTDNRARNEGKRKTKKLEDPVKHQVKKEKQPIKKDIHERNLVK